MWRNQVSADVLLVSVLVIKEQPLIRSDITADFDRPVPLATAIRGHTANSEPETELSAAAPSPWFLRTPHPDASTSWEGSDDPQPRQGYTTRRSFRTASLNRHHGPDDLRPESNRSMICPLNCLVLPASLASLPFGQERGGCPSPSRRSFLGVPVHTGTGSIASQGLDRAAQTCGDVVYFAATVRPC